MKFRLKITLIMLCIISVLFSLGGSMLINVSYSSSLKRERTSAYDNYTMLLNTLIVVNKSGNFKDIEEIVTVIESILSENQNQWYALRVQTEDEIIYEEGMAREFSAKTRADVTPETCYISGVTSVSGKNCMKISGAFLINENIFYLDALRDISNISSTRMEQQTIYKYIFTVMIILCTVVTYTVAWLLTRPLSKLSVASRKIAQGDLSYRSAIKSSDEIGALSVDFDNMAEKMEENVADLKSAKDRQERFTRSFTHELKTPMASIIGFSDLLRGQSLDENEQQEATNYIFSEAKRLENLSLRLLELFVMENDEIKRKKLSLRILIERFVNAERKRLEPLGIEITSDCKKGNVYIEPDLIRTLLMNLIDNAVKAMENGGKIHISSEIYSGMITIKVSDDGRGMPPEAIEHITEAFYTVDKNRSRKQGGSGLGLSLCSKIVELHGGKMTFNSKIGEGTDVIIRIRGTSI